MKISVIFSTYNSPAWMEKVLWGFYYQSYRDFEVIVADDGSTDETRERIEAFSRETGMAVKHVWQEDDGFQKCRVLNKAIKQTTGDYLLFTDGDCIPRKDFVAVHAMHAEPGYFLSGGYFKLPMQTSEAIEAKHIKSGEAFDPQWLIQHGLKKSHKIMKLTAKGWRARLLNALTPTKATWNGHNVSGWKSDVEAANGFDERMQYGGEDRELGERLFNKGIKSKQIRYSAICIHLDHARGYVTPEMINKNRAIRKETDKNRAIRTPFGLVKD